MDLKSLATKIRDRFRKPVKVNPVKRSTAAFTPREARSMGRLDGYSVFRRVFGFRPLKRNKGRNAKRFAARRALAKVAKQARKVNR
jgi:hypothetical protein